MSGFDDIAMNIAAGVKATTLSKLEAPDIRRVLRFLSKVALVVDQAMEDVLALAIDLSYVGPSELTSERRNGYLREIELLSSRSHYRDMEEICSRLKMLNLQYDSQIRDLLSRGVDTREWGRLFSLIDEREGIVVWLVKQSVERLSQLLSGGAGAEEVNQEARAIVNRLKKSLVDLRNTTNSILGLSGSPGLMELTEVNRASVAQHSIVQVFDMSNSKNVTFGDNAQFSGNLVVAEMVRDSLNVVSKVDDKGLREALAQLTTEVETLCRQLPGEEQMIAARRLRALAEEASSSKPDKSVLSVNAKGLVEAAQAVAAMVGPISTAVRSVLSFF